MPARILVVDDDRDLSRLLVRLLGVAGCTVVPAYDAATGLMHLRKERFDLVLLDLQMPAGGGESLLLKLGQLGYLPSLPVVVMTALRDPDLEARTRAEGARDFVRKPLDIDDLLARVKAIVGA